MAHKNPNTILLTPLSADQYASFTALVQSIDDQQATWLAGYFAGFSARFSMEPSESDPTKVLTIVYGSTTGKGEEMATLAATKAKHYGLNVRLLDMCAFSANDLLNTSNLLVVVSTHGKGAPPFAAKGLHDYLFSKNAPTLNAMKYAVLALGDSSYDHFCQVGIEFDQQLEKLGATRLLQVLLGDVDVDSTAPTWLDEALPLFESGKSYVTDGRFTYLKNHLNKTKTSSYLKNSTLHSVINTSSLPGKSNPFSAPVLEKYNLHGAGSDRQTIHLALKADVPGMDYQPGDSAGVIPLNHPNLVREVLDITGFEGSQEVAFKDQKQTLETILRESVELSRVTLDVIKKYLTICPLESLHSLAANRDILAEYTTGRDIVDLLTDFPTEGLSPEAFLSILRPLQPRYYSISSSPLETPGNVHLTVGVVTYENAGRTRKGTCSSYLSDATMKEVNIPIFIEANPHFRLPEDPTTPIIMLGAGTGIAPFRAFVQHRSHTENPGKSWLFFGNRFKDSEFLYEKEWEQHLQTGALTCLDVAFSRDGNAVKHVQDCLQEKAEEVYQWLEEGAHLYLCGDMNGFATDVQQALKQIISEKGRRTAEEAETYLDELQYSGRFQLDVY